MTSAATRSGSTAAVEGNGELKLRLVLRANAASCTISGLVMAVGPGTIDELLGTGHPGWVRLVGLALLPFAALVIWLSAANDHLLQRVTPAIIAGDVGWVVGSVATVLLGWYSGSGTIAVLAMAALVDVFAVLQFSAVRRLRRC